MGQGGTTAAPTAAELEKIAQSHTDAPPAPSLPPGLIPEDMDKVLAFIDQRVAERLAIETDGLREARAAFDDGMRKVEQLLEAMPTGEVIDAKLGELVDAKIGAQPTAALNAAEPGALDQRVQALEGRVARLAGGHF